MGRSADTSDDEGDCAASDEDDEDGESALKRRKVVLVKAQPAASEQGADDGASKSTASSAPRPRTKPLAGGTAGRILREMLGGQPSRLGRSAAERERPQRQANSPVPARTSATAASSASTDAASALPDRSRPPAATAKKTVDAVKRQLSAAPAKIVKTKLSKPDSKKATLSKRSASSGTGGQKAASTASATLMAKAVGVLREATARSASPCSAELRAVAVDKSSAQPGTGTGKKHVRSATVRTKVQKGTTASTKKVTAKTKRPAKTVSTAGASSATAKSPKVTLSSGSAPVRERDASDSRASSASPSRQSSSSSSPPPARARVPEKKSTKKSRTASSPKKVRVSKPLTPSPAAAQGSSLPRQQALSAADEGGFQDLVLDRLRNLCGENEDAKVLAEYIVVMVAGAKGRDEMARELKPFFQDQAQAESFVDWVEECKWKFLTGGPSPAAARTVSAAAGSTHQQAASGSSASRPLPPADFWGPAPPGQSAASSSSGTGRSSSRQVDTGGSKLRSPHVAVTSRVVLQPNPNFDDSPPSSPSEKRPSGVGFTKAAAKSIPAVLAAASAPQAMASKPAAVASKPDPAVSAPVAKSSAPAPAARGQKNELLHNMTNQLQLILTKLQDKSLPDETREKYQALAQNIQVQMAKITTKPPAQASKLPMGRRR